MRSGTGHQVLTHTHLHTLTAPSAWPLQMRSPVIAPAEESGRAGSPGFELHCCAESCPRASLASPAAFSQGIRESRAKMANSIQKEKVKIL